jgi:hypothetical protein
MGQEIIVIFLPVAAGVIRRLLDSIHKTAAGKADSGFNQ